MSDINEIYDVTNGFSKDFKLVETFNNTKSWYPKDKTLQELFEEQVERTPDKVAVVFGEEQISYRELNIKANQLARNIRNKGLTDEGITAVIVENSLETIIGMLATLKAGGAYLPIDPHYPKERIEYMLSDSNASILITQKNNINYIKFSGEKIYLDNANSYEYDSSNLDVINSSRNLGMVKY